MQRRDLLRDILSDLTTGDNDPIAGPQAGQLQRLAIGAGYRRVESNGVIDQRSRTVQQREEQGRLAATDGDQCTAISRELRRHPDAAGAGLSHRPRYCCRRWGGRRQS